MIVMFQTPIKVTDEQYDEETLEKALKVAVELEEALDKWAGRDDKRKMDKLLSLNYILNKQNKEFRSRMIHRELKANDVVRMKK